MKKLKKKKKKTRKNWSKQSGCFSLENADYTSGIFPTMDVFFKGEKIGKAHTNVGLTKKHSYTLNIYEPYDAYNPFRDVRIIGTIECKGTVHFLPKSVIKIELISKKTILNLERKVLVEKIMKIYTGSLYTHFPVTGFLPPTDINDIYRIR